MIFVQRSHAPDGRPRTVFVSYAREDEGWKDKIISALKPLEAARGIAAWNDRELVPGEDWAKTIDARITESDVFLFLVSPDFLDSSFISTVELPRAIARQEKGEAVVVPIIVRGCDWEKSSLARYQAYPLDGTPLAEARDSDLDDLREKIHFALLGWWYPRRPRGATGPHAMWQLQYRASNRGHLPSIPELVKRLREIADEPDIETHGSSDAQVVGGTARVTDPTLWLDGPAKAFARLEALHAAGPLSDALGVSIADLQLIVGATMQARSGPSIADRPIATREQLVLTAGSREMPDLPQVLMLRDDDPDWRMILPARGTEGATPKALFGEMRELFTEYLNTILAAPDGRLTVNLSAYEPDNMLPPALQGTRLGRDLVEQDCRLKQFAASLLHPDTSTGGTYWRRLRAQAKTLGLHSESELASFSKVWIVPGLASLGAKDPDQPLRNAGLESLGVRETDRGAWIERCDLQLMCDVDYIARERSGLASLGDEISKASIALFREIVIPTLTDEVNNGAWFATLRQIYRAFVLGTWVRKDVAAIPAFESLARMIDCGKPELFGVQRDVKWAESAADIYRRYVDLFEDGVFRCVRLDEESQPRMYFSGGITLA